MYFQLLTGCRPSETAFLIMTQKSFRKNPYTRSSQNLPAFRGDWMATMPASETKTGVEYKWDIPTRSNPAVKLLLALH